MKEKNSHLPTLRRRVAKAPSDPGVYRWLDKDGTVLYVGKAKNLRNRLKSYVQKEPDLSIGPWKLALISRIADLDVTVTNSELEALILETNLIKELKPKYNVMMKDGKNYVYVRITVKDPYPSIAVVRQMQEDKAKYFGPFLSAHNLKKTLDMLHSVFRFRACKESIDRLNREKEAESKACLEYQIGRCNGLCVGDVTQEQYREAVEQVMRFLKGDRREVIERLRELMQEAAVHKKFERAAKLRDTLEYIESLEQQIVSDTSGANTDVLGVALQEGKSQVVLLRERGGKLISELSFALAGHADTASEVLSQFLPQYYSETQDIPDTIIVGEPIEETGLLEDWLSTARKKQVAIHVPERGKKSKLLKMAETNAQQKVRQQLTKWEAAAGNTEDALKALQKLLELPSIPKRIEGYDISHLSGTETVGSMVVLRNGKTANDQYRSFTIRTLKEGEIDDYKALREVLTRRLRYLTEHVKEEEGQWKKQEITFGKARKGEQEVLQKLHGKDIDYKGILVARSNDEIIGTAMLLSLKGDITKLEALWVKPEYRGKKLGQFLEKKILRTRKKGKVYLICKPDLYEYHSQIGFRHVLSPPKALEEKMKGKKGARIIMVYDSQQNKPDKSLESRPDLLVIDGGKGQLGAVVEVLKEFKLEIPVLGLAKREEDVFVPKRKAPILFPKDSQAKFLLMRLRDEAHRFANRHREKRGKKAAITSALDAVEGIGEKTKSELLKEFGSVSRIAKASDQDLLRVLSNSQLTALRRHL